MIDQLHATIREHAAGYPQPSLESDRTSGHTTVTDDQGDPMPAVADPTGEISIAPDQARADERHLDQLIRRLYSTATDIDAIHRRHLEAPDRDALARLQVEGEPGCEIVARARDARGQPEWEPVFRTSDVDGNLPRPYRLGRWAYDWVRRYGQLPTIDEIRRHLEGRKPRRHGG